MGIGVTQVEIELAERLGDGVPSVERVLLTARAARRRSTRSASRARRRAGGT